MVPNMLIRRCDQSDISDMLGFMTRRITGDLERFKEFIESRGQATGAWRGEVRQEH